MDTATPYTIIVCTHNRANILARCLRAAAREAKALGVPGEIVLVDSASTDETKAVAELMSQELGDKLQLRYFFESEANLSVARNRGVDEATGEILVFLDDDAIPCAGWLESCIAAFAKHPPALAVGGEVAPLLSGPAPEWFRAPLIRMFTVIDLGGSSIRPFPPDSHPVGANMAFRRSVFATRRFSARLGRSGQSLISGEEAEICGSIRDSGGELLYVPTMKVEHVIHPERLTERWVRDRYFFEGVSRARMGFGWRTHAITVFKQLLKLSFLIPAGLFYRTTYQRLLWNCRIRWSVGYVSELFGLANFANVLFQRYSPTRRRTNDAA